MQHDEDAGVEAEIGIDPRQQLGQFGARQHVLGNRVRAPRPLQQRVAQQIAGDLVRHEVEHDRGDHLVRPGRGLEPSRKRAPQRADDRADGERQRQVNEPRQAGDGETDIDRRQSADDHLAFRADVEQTRPETERNAEPGERHRRRGGQRLRERGDRAERPEEQRAIGLADPRNVDTGREHDHRSGDRREKHRDHRNDHQVFRIEPAGRAAAQRFLGAGPVSGGVGHAATSAFPPAIARPMDDFDAPPGNSPAMRPRYITRMRSESARISSSSVETINTPTPRSRASTMRL